MSSDSYQKNSWLLRLRAITSLWGLEGDSPRWILVQGSMLQNLIYWDIHIIELLKSKHKKYAKLSPAIQSMMREDNSNSKGIFFLPGCFSWMFRMMWFWRDWHWEQLTQYPVRDITCCTTRRDDIRSKNGSSSTPETLKKRWALLSSNAIRLSLLL